MTKSRNRFTFDKPAPNGEEFDRGILISYSKTGPDLLFRHFLKPTNLECRNEANQTLLHIAVCYREVTKVKFLLELGAKTEEYVEYSVTIDTDKDTQREIKANYFLTPLLVIASKKTNDLADYDREIVKLLVKNGADINASDLEHCETSLHWAVLNSNYSLVELLLELGADPNITDNQDNKPQDYADNNEIFELFQKYQNMSRCTLM